MIWGRVLRYAIVLLMIFIILSVIALHKYWYALEAYFSSSISAVAGSVLYILIIIIGIAMMIRAAFR